MASRRIAAFLMATFLLIIGVAKGEDDVQINISGDDSIATGLRFFLRLYDDCSKRDGLSPCLKMKAITFFDRAMRTSEIPLTDTLVLVQNSATSEDTSVSADKQQTHIGRSLTEAEIEASLPTGDYEARDLQLNQLLLDRLSRFFNTYKIQFAFPKLETTELKRNLEEGVYQQFYQSQTLAYLN
jgi:hypothetical protein